MDKIKDSISKKDIDSLLCILLDINNINCDYNELLDILDKFYKKEVDVSNVVFNLNLWRNGKEMKRRTPGSGFFLYEY